MALFCQATGFLSTVTYIWIHVICINSNQDRDTCIFTPRVPHDDGHQVVCRAHRVVSMLSDPYTIQLNYPPPSPPIIRGYREGSVLTEGETITLDCVVKGQKSVRFFCGDEPDNPDIVDDMSVWSPVVINVRTKQNNTVCLCSATWSPQPRFYSDTSFVRLYVNEMTHPTTTISGSEMEGCSVSQSVRISTNATQPFVTDGTTQMALFCQTDGVSPPVSYTWAGVECINEHHQRGTCIFTPRVPQDDGLQVTCDAYNEISLELWTSEPYTIQLSYPPPSPPNITGYKEGSVLTEGEQITLKCTVHGGKPKVTSVTFYCGDGRDSTDVFGDEFVTSSVVITVQTKHNNTVCKCSATWTQHQMYRDTTFIRLFVRGFISTTPDRVYSSSSPQDEVGQSVPTGVIAGVAVAIVAIIVAIAIAIVVYVTRRQQNQSTAHNTRFKDNTQHDGKYATPEKKRIVLNAHIFKNMSTNFTSALALNTIHPVDDLTQSRVQDPVAQPSPHKASVFTDKGCTTQGASNSSPSLSAHEQQATQPCLKELEKNCESTMSNTENLYAVVADRDLCGSKP
ncbi:hypothetical protein C0Q70_12840 [Pomacea canaliculata]|uniref:Ig-like domain-containing protein n=1 Tax=Pomacea canaliculata TaxID=400727 RepID=A0A2T7P2R0_POMCA|nr:hypothetical protein C0Q70_12840 [Pomacea canaliculata]